MPSELLVDGALHRWPLRVSDGLRWQRLLTVTRRVRRQLSRAWAVREWRLSLSPWVRGRDVRDGRSAVSRQLLRTRHLRQRSAAGRSPMQL